MDRREHPGTLASTTRAPSRSRSETHASAASLDSVVRPSPMAGAVRSKPTVSPSSRGSGTGRAASTDQNRATSSTLRPIGPTVSNDGQSGKTPVVGTSPSRVFSPTVSHAAEGRRIEQPVSVPMPRSQRPAASAAALPLEEPPVVLPGCVGLWHVPYHWLAPSTLQANSGRCALPTTTAPAATARSTTTAFRSGTWSA